MRATFISESDADSKAGGGPHGGADAPADGPPPVDGRYFQAPHVSGAPGGEAAVGDAARGARAAVAGPSSVGCFQWVPGFAGDLMVLVMFFCSTLQLMCEQLR